MTGGSAAEARPDELQMQRLAVIDAAEHLGMAALDGRLDLIPDYSNTLRKTVTRLLDLSRAHSRDAAFWRAEADRLRAEVDRLGAGSYEATACRGHFHITCAGHQIINEWGDALDEETARHGAATLNARAKQDVELWRAQADRMRDALEQIGYMGGEPEFKSAEAKAMAEIARAALAASRPAKEDQT